MNWNKKNLANAQVATDIPDEIIPADWFNNVPKEPKVEELEPPPYDDRIPTYADVPPEGYGEQQSFAPPFEMTDEIYRQAEEFNRGTEGYTAQEPSPEELAYMAEREAEYFPPDEAFNPVEPPPEYFEEQYIDESIIYPDEPPMPPESEPQPAPEPKEQKDNQIMITSEMITGRKSYAISQDYLDEILDKIFERLDIPAVEFKTKAESVKEVIVETGGNAPTALSLVTDKGIEEVPLGTNERNQLDNSLDEYEKNNVDKEK